MPLTQRIQDQFQASIQVLIDAADSLTEPIGQSARIMTDCLLGEGKILTCGLGPSRLASEHLAGILTDRFEKDRPGLAAIPLRSEGAAMVDDADPSQGLARQVLALGHPGDILVVFSTYGHAPAAVEAVRAAQERELRVVVITGGDSGLLGEQLSENDILICVPAESTPRIHETILLTVHCLCDGIDFFLLGA